MAIDQVPDAQRNRARGLTEQNGPALCPLPTHASQPALQQAGQASHDSVCISEEAREAHGRDMRETPTVTALAQALYAMMHERPDRPLLQV